MTEEDTKTTRKVLSITQHTLENAFKCPGCPVHVPNKPGVIVTRIDISDPSDDCILTIILDSVEPRIAVVARPPKDPSEQDQTCRSFPASNTITETIAHVLKSGWEIINK